ncbi:hypothetical protein BDA96_02G000300 [Sorghum bicolor]|uniref:Uncharacterized protein n=2 Tax=Sorghum bicolor TaxID=4558 RepID=A0A921RKF0_SORBI|nr:hypothetical protein BDA96_02G000300 [Sorghum bicolor]OQU88281.1 hypothetical protein SORBI_3002G000350 [Sorghum bicolor]
MCTAANKDDTFFSKMQESCVSLYYEENADTFLPNKSVKNDRKHFCSYRNNNTTYKALLNTLHPQSHILCLALYHWLILITK